MAIVQVSLQPSLLVQGIFPGAFFPNYTQKGELLLVIQKPDSGFLFLLMLLHDPKKSRFYQNQKLWTEGEICVKSRGFRLFAD